MSFHAVNGMNGDIMQQQQQYPRSPTTPTSPVGHGIGRQSSFSNSNIRSSQYVAHNEKDWIEIQKFAFTNWCNEQLRSSGIVITDLSTAFEDGVTIVYLVEAVSVKKVGRWNRNPKMYAQKLENTTAALKLLEQDGIQLVNIGNEDLVNGNMKLILGLIWRLILHYQISSGGSTSGKQLLLLWLRNALPDMTIKNVTTDWNNGIALTALVNFCQPGLMPNYNSLDPNDKLRNVTVAMKMAEDKLRIPQILSPEFFVSPYVDELSMMTYLSFFTQPGSPGERRTLEIINEEAPKLRARNFNTDWSSGQALGLYLESRTPGIVPDYDQFDTMTPVQRANKGLEVAEEKLDIKKVLTGKEMTNPDVDELSLMAYMLQFRNCKQLQSHASQFSAEGPGLRRAIRGRASEFQVFGRRDLGMENIKVKVAGPSGREIQVSVRQTLDGLKCHYTPEETGAHQVSITHVGKHIPSSPYRVETVEDVSETMVSGQGLKNAVVLKPAEFIIKMSTPTSAPVTAVAEGPTRSIPIDITKQYDGSYLARFIPREVGEHKISVMVGNSVLPGCPFTSKVGDHTKVLLTPKDSYRPQLGKPVTFEVDTTHAGLGELAIKCKGPKGGIPVDVRGTSRGKYLVSYTPTIPGEYLTQCTFNGEEIPSSPNITVISDPNQIVASGAGLYQVATESQGEFSITFHGAARDGLEVFGEGPQGRFPVRLVENPTQKDTYSVYYTPQGIGMHKIHVLYHGEPVKGSPFLVKVADPSKVKFIPRPFPEGKGHVVGREVDIPVLVPQEAGEGTLEAEVVDPDLGAITSTVTFDPSDGYHHIKFRPRRRGTHRVAVKYGAKDVPASPYEIRVGDPTSVRVRESIHTRQGFKTSSEIDIPIEVPQDVGELSATVRGPGGEFVDASTKIENDGLYHVRFTPSRSGRYTVDILCAGHHIENSPMVMNVLEEAAMKVKLKEFEKQDKIRYRVGQPLDVPMQIPEEVKDVSAEVKGPHGEHVLSSFAKESDGDHHLRFTPFKKGDYTVDIKCRGKPVDGSPFGIRVGDPSSTLVRMRQAEAERTQYIAQREIDITFDIPEDHWEVTTLVQGPDDEIMPSSSSSITKGEDGYYHVKFMPYRPGVYKVHVRCDGEPVDSSPFLITVGEPVEQVEQVSHVRSEELYSEQHSERFISNEVDFAVEGSADMDERLFRANVVGPDGVDRSCNLSRDLNGRHHIKFQPQSPGQYKVFVWYSDELIEGAPFIVNVMDESRVRVDMTEYTENYEAYQEADFKIMTPPQTRPEQLSARVYDPHGNDVPCSIARGLDSSQYHVRFVPSAVGAHKMHVYYDNNEIDGSPYTINIMQGQVSAEKVAQRVHASGSGIKKAFVSETSQFNVDTSDAGGEGQLTARMYSLHDRADVDIQKRSNGAYHCSYVAPSTGAYTLHMYWNGKEIRDSPFKVDVHDSLSSRKSYCKVQGEAFSEYGAYVNQWMKFWIDTNGQGDGPLYVRCSGPTKDCDVKVYDNQDGTYDIQIYPTETGTHELHVSWGKRVVHGSPFLIRVGQEPDPSQVYAYGPGLEHGILDLFQGNFLVETKGAGPGTLKIRIHGPKGAFKVEMYRDNQAKDRRIGVRYNPNESGRYTINIKWAEHHIPGSPFEVHILDTQQEYDSLSELHDNVVVRSKGGEATPL